MRLSRRSGTTGLSPQQELQGWACVFEVGADYFHDLSRLGIDQDEMDPADFLELAQEAWKRLGSAFLKNWTPTTSRPIPWAAQ